LNERDNAPPELVAKFIDGKLRTGSKGSTDEELENLLNQVMILLSYIHGKDVFQAFYKKDLAKRLLLGQSASTDVEKSMIAKIKLECGAIYTSKLESMFKDIELSKDIMKDFEKQQGYSQGGSSKIEMKVQVLTTSSWPNYVPTELRLPIDIAALQHSFQLYYLNKHSGRKLTWQHSLTTCILRAHFPKGKKELDVSAHQATVLIAFNDAPTLTFKELQERTTIEEGELQRTLLSLCGTPQVRVIVKEPSMEQNKKIETTDKFHFNKHFKHKLVRIKINTIQLQETKEEKKTTDERVFADRQFAIDAAIVRIMKSRKTLQHSLLIAETVKQLKFPSKIPEIKKRIASLIEREYIERDKDNSSLYIYQA